MAVYYNEFDPFAAEWLQNMMRKGLIPDGEIDTRSILDVRPDDLAGFTQCHFFAGIAGWSEALRLAGWDPARPVWTGSCPCQPFSVAGRGKGTADERHLWPAFFRLIAECSPSTVFGEQVASKAGRAWLSGVFVDLESVGYAGAGADLCAAGVGAPHIRQRLYWVARSLGDMADADISIGGQRGVGLCGQAASGKPGVIGENDMADAEGLGRRGRAHVEDEGRREQPFADPCAGSRDMVDAASLGRREGWPEHELRGRGSAVAGAGSSDVADADDAGREGWQLLPERPDEFSPWSRGVEWRRGADGKERRVKSGVRLLAPGISGGVALERTLPSGEKETHVYSRVGALRGLGNAIVPPLAAEFIKAIM